MILVVLSVPAAAITAVAVTLKRWNTALASDPTEFTELVNVFLAVRCTVLTHVATAGIRVAAIREFFTAARLTTPRREVITVLATVPAREGTTENILDTEKRRVAVNVNKALSALAGVLDSRALNVTSACRGFTAMRLAVPVRVSREFSRRAACLIVDADKVVSAVRLFPATREVVPLSVINAVITRWDTRFVWSAPLTVTRADRASCLVLLATAVGVRTTRALKDLATLC